MCGNLLMNECRLFTLAGPILGIFEDQVRLNCKTVVIASMPAQAEDVEDEADDLKKPTNFSVLDWNEIRRKLIS